MPAIDSTQQKPDFDTTDSADDVKTGVKSQGSNVLFWVISSAIGAVVLLGAGLGLGFGLKGKSSKNGNSTPGQNGNQESGEVLR